MNCVPVSSVQICGIRKKCLIPSAAHFYTSATLQVHQKTHPVRTPRPINVSFNRIPRGAHNYTFAVWKLVFICTAPAAKPVGMLWLNSRRNYLCLRVPFCSVRLIYS